MFNRDKPKPPKEVVNLPCRYALKICPSMPGLNASRPQCLKKIWGRRHEGAAREDKKCFNKK